MAFVMTVYTILSGMFGVDMHCKPWTVGKLCNMETNQPTCNRSRLDGIEDDTSHVINVIWDKVACYLLNVL